MPTIEEVRDLLKRADAQKREASALEGLLREMRLGAEVEASPRKFRFFGAMSLSGPREKTWLLGQDERKGLIDFLYQRCRDLDVSAQSLEAQAVRSSEDV